MSKQLLEDMVKIKKKETRAKILPKETKVKEGSIQNINLNPKKNRSRYLLWFVALVSIVFCFFAFSFLFLRAEITVNPKILDVVLDENLSAVKGSNGDSLSFDLVVISGEESKVVKATGEKDVAEKATGVVVLYNAFSSAPQTLNIDTRLEGSNGKMYKTQKRVVVPGMTKDKPGSVEVGIYGDKAGEEYNSIPLDFKIFGFKGTSKYSKFYGRSKGPIAGGFKGKMPAVSDAEKTNAGVELKDSLRAKLLQKSINQIPDGFILFKDAIFLETGDSKFSSTYNNTDSTATFVQKGTLYGILFNEQKLTKKIALGNIEKYDGSDIYISNIRDLVFTLPNKDNISFNDLKNLNFNLSGSAKVVYKLDTNKFVNDLLGKNKIEFNQTLSQYPNIDSATLTINLPWKNSIPEKSKDVKVVVNYPK